MYVYESDTCVWDSTDLTRTWGRMMLIQEGTDHGEQGPCPAQPHCARLPRGKDRTHKSIDLCGVSWSDTRETHLCCAVLDGGGAESEARATTPLAVTHTHVSPLS